MAQFSLKQTLADIAPGLPADFDARKGIVTLFPGQSSSIKLLTSYHFLYSDSLQAVGVHCDYTIDIWGSGKWRFSGLVSNVDFINADYSLVWAFRFTQGVNAFGDVLNGNIVLRSSDHFDYSGSQEWIKKIWPQAFASGVTADLKVNESPAALIAIIVAPIVVVLYMLGGRAYVEDQTSRAWSEQMNPPPP